MAATDPDPCELMDRTQSGQYRDQLEPEVESLSYTRSRRGDPNVADAGHPDGPTPKTFKVNRSRQLRFMLERAGWREAQPGEKAAFAYWDIYGDVPPVKSAVNNWPRRITNSLDNLVTFFTYLQSFPGLAERAAPETHLDWRDLSEAEFLDGAAPETGRLWFLKQAFGVGGKGITLLNSWREYRACVEANAPHPCTITGPGLGNGRPLQLKDTWLIQKSVEDVMTITGGKCGSGKGWYRTLGGEAGGRKTLLRCYFVSRGDGAFFMFGDALLYVHPVPYDPLSTDPAVADSHGSGEVAATILRPQAGQSQLVRAPVVGGRACFRLSEWEDQESALAISKHMLETAKELVPVIHGTMERDREDGPPRLCSAHENSETRMLYQFWGVDFLPTMDSKTLEVTGAKFIEMNGWPNMSHDRGVAAEKAQHDDLDAGMMELLGFYDKFKAETSTNDCTKQMWRQLSGPVKSTEAEFAAQGLKCDHVPNYPPFGEGVQGGLQYLQAVWAGAPYKDEASTPLLHKVNHQPDSAASADV
jgi:hypothetical protein